MDSLLDNLAAPTPASSISPLVGPAGKTLGCGWSSSRVSPRGKPEEETSPVSIGEGGYGGSEDGGVSEWGGSTSHGSAR